MANIVNTGARNHLTDASLPATTPPTLYQKKIASLSLTKFSDLSILAFTGLDVSKTYRITFQASIRLPIGPALLTRMFYEVGVDIPTIEVATTYISLQQTSGISADNTQTASGIFTGANLCVPTINFSHGSFLDGGGLTWALLEELPNHVPTTWSNV